MHRALGLCLTIAMSSSAAGAGGLRDENVLTPIPTGFRLGDSTNQGALTMAE